MAEKETEPISGTLWYLYKELEKMNKVQIQALNHRFFSLRNLFRTTNETVLVHSTNIYSFEMDDTGYSEQDDLVVKEAMLMSTALLVSDFL